MFQQAKNLPVLPLLAFQPKISSAVGRPWFDDVLGILDFWASEPAGAGSYTEPWSEKQWG